jgi:hypothetical protein
MTSIARDWRTTRTGVPRETGAIDQGAAPRTRSPVDAEALGVQAATAAEPRFSLNTLTRALSDYTTARASDFCRHGATGLPFPSQSRIPAQPVSAYV